MLAAFALLCIGASGCFALFPLDEYGPGAGDGGEEGALSEGGNTDASTDAFVRHEGSIAFVTSTKMQGGSLDGTAGADRLCQDIANDTGLDGSFKAFLGDRNDELSSRLRRDGGKIVTRGGGLVAQTFDELLKSGPSAAFVEDERGKAVSRAGTCDEGAAAWSGVLPDGGRVDGMSDCGRWNFSGGVGGIAGSIGQTGGAWASACLRPCGNPASLYCFQQ